MYLYKHRVSSSILSPEKWIIWKIIYFPMTHLNLWTVCCIPPAAIHLFMVVSSACVCQSNTNASLTSSQHWVIAVLPEAPVCPSLVGRVFFQQKREVTEWEYYGLLLIQCSFRALMRKISMLAPKIKCSSSSRES